MNILDEIVANKRTEIEETQKTVPLETLKKQAFETEVVRRPFRALFEKGPVLIAEIKPKSPSMGELITQPPLEVAKLYAKSSADVISVLTDKKYFGGDLQLMKDVRALVPQTILRKEFIIDEYQIYETAVAGSDAFLLIASILTPEELAAFIELGASLGLDALVETHNENEVEKAVNAGATCIGVNNRDLKTLAIDLAVTERLLTKIPDTIPAVSESGIETAADVERVRIAGAGGILVGTSILQSGDPTLKIAELKQAMV